ncbi:MAG: putative toxin-antitoxin system toxin component, PIN family [Candidatus Thermoplasmatota archaeon]|nr:putative toxin-antitoxin system toxin component, PIN family [Candidatus Thermoplasmatota archaeon]
MRVFLDTNVLISTYCYKGNERKLLEGAIRGKYTGFTSPIVIDELQRIIEKKFGEEPINTQTYIEKLLSVLNLVKDISLGIDILDRNDDQILGAATTTKCRYLATGDKKLLSVGRMGTTEIASAIIKEMKTF